MNFAHSECVKAAIPCLAVFVRNGAAPAEIMGHSFIAPDMFNCAVSNISKGEVLVRDGHEARKSRWLQPLLTSGVRVAFGLSTSVQNGAAA